MKPKYYNMLYFKDGKKHFVRSLQVCEIIELDNGTDIILVNNKVIHLEEDYLTVCKAVVENEEINLNFRK